VGVAAPGPPTPPPPLPPNDPVLPPVPPFPPRAVLPSKRTPTRETSPALTNSAPPIPAAPPPPPEACAWPPSPPCAKPSTKDSPAMVALPPSTKRIGTAPSPLIARSSTPRPTMVISVVMLGRIWVSVMVEPAGSANWIVSAPLPVSPRSVVASSLAAMIASRSVTCPSAATVSSAVLLTVSVAARALRAVNSTRHTAARHQSRGGNGTKRPITRRRFHAHRRNVLFATSTPPAVERALPAQLRFTSMSLSPVSVDPFVYIVSLRPPGAPASLPSIGRRDRAIAAAAHRCPVTLTLRGSS
jgi:hypothetical protein